MGSWLVILPVFSAQLSSYVVKAGVATNRKAVSYKCYPNTAKLHSVSSIKALASVRAKHSSLELPTRHLVRPHQHSTSYIIFGITA